MGSHVAAPVLTPNVKYNSERDFEPIGFTAHAPAMIVANKDFPAKNLREFVDYLKKKHGDGVKQAHGGIGSSSHMACLLFASAAGVRPSLVAYRGTGPALNNPIGGHVDFFCEQAVSVAPQIAAGTIKAYGISSRNAPANATKGASDYGLKVIGVARDNTNAAFDFTGQLMTVKSLSEMVELSTAHTRKQYEALTAQSEQLFAIAQNAATDSIKPVKESFSKAFNTIG
jgi:tripartite tricarboxylate transporter family receptor/phasin protein